MTTELNTAPVGNSKKAKSDALSHGLWKALWIAVAVCVLWLGCLLYTSDAADE